MKTYYIADNEYADSIYGDQNPICIDMAEIVRLAREWDMTTEELLEQFHEASSAEIDEYGKYDSLWYAVMQDNEDDDWGTGSYDLLDAKAKVAAYKASGYPDAYIAVIDEGYSEDGKLGDPICVDEIR